MKITESPSHYNELQTLSTASLLAGINSEDQMVARAIETELESIEKLVDAVVLRVKEGGRLFYLGAGTSGRLGILDAAECPPTYGVSPDLVIGLIAGGEKAIRQPVENAEDSLETAAEQLKHYRLTERDNVIGITASGTTPYVLAGLSYATQKGALTGCITCNPNTTVAGLVDYPIQAIVGPEFVTGSTRMKAGTAQKLILNMLSTCLMIKLGRVQGNKMVNMQLTNAKLIKRGVAMLVDELEITEQEAEKLLEEHGSVRAVLDRK